MSGIKPWIEGVRADYPAIGLPLCSPLITIVTIRGEIREMFKIEWTHHHKLVLQVDGLNLNIKWQRKFSLIQATESKRNASMGRNGSYVKFW